MNTPRESSISVAPEGLNSSTIKNEDLLGVINSPDFTLYNCIELLCKYSDNIGIHYYLCQKLLTYSHADLQFYIPQLVQILLTVETESMALEDLLLKLKNENPHFALLTFWQLQALLTDLSTDPESYGFQVARRVLNNLQSSLFNTNLIDDIGSNPVNKSEKMNENVAPAIVFASMVMSSMAVPQLSEMTKPLVESQGQKQKSYVFKLARNAMKDFTKNITLKNTTLNKKKSVANSRLGSGSKTDKRNFSSESRSATIDFIESTKSKEDVLFRKPKVVDPIEQKSLDFSMIDDIGNQVFEENILSSIKLPKRKTKFLDDSFVHRVYESKNLEHTDICASLVDQEEDRKSNHHHHSPTNTSNAFNDIDESNLENFTNSMPDLRKVTPMRSSMSTLKKVQAKPVGLTRSNTQPESHFDKLRQRKSNYLLTKNIDISKIPTTKKIKLLKTNYFRCETQFAIALESISQRLAQVPTEARLSALRAELSLMNRDLPAEVDIPTLLPPNKKGKLHRLVLITANEAQVLNSAEKVPYLLLIEYLRDDFDFDPTIEENENVLKKSSVNIGPLFDLNYLSKKTHNRNDFISLVPGSSTTANTTNNSFEDLNNSKTSLREGSYSIPNSPTPNVYSNGKNNSSIVSTQTKEMDLGDLSIIKMKNQTDAEAYRNTMVLQTAAKVPMIPSNSPDRNPELNFVQTIDEVIKPIDSNSNSKEDKETDDLADQMRISALMLAQLDQSPQELSDATNQIRAQIIASMKEVQDKFGYKDLEAIHGKAGERRLENDLMTGGIDTSYLGEDWQSKKERIRSQSQYGHLDNWDLCSVIAKSGDDLRQEAFACQLIQAMAQIWSKEKADIWVKKMKILITSANTGLVETITNAMSVHSIKKSLTRKMIDDGDLDEKGGIASISDHFLRAFGSPDGFKYKRAQDNFASSLAAYSLICYILRVKDRHNGNIMIDNEGHVVHIDFGFMLSNSPGSVGFEAAPFKLTYEYVDVLGGTTGEPYKKFVRLMKEGFKALRNNCDQIISMCEIMQKDNMQPCFEAGDQTSVQLRQRFHLELNSDKEVDDFVETLLIGKSLGSIYTRLYDQFQLLTQGIFS